MDFLLTVAYRYNNQRVVISVDHSLAGSLIRSFVGGSKYTAAKSKIADNDRTIFASLHVLIIFTRDTKYDKHTVNTEA